jgi:hypothetical protein
MNKVVVVVQGGSVQEIFVKEDVEVEVLDLDTPYPNSFSDIYAKYDKLLKDKSFKLTLPTYGS